MLENAIVRSMIMQWLLAASKHIIFEQDELNLGVPTAPENPFPRHPIRSSFEGRWSVRGLPTTKGI